MFFFKKKPKRRRLDVRKGIPSVGLGFWQRFRDAGGVGSVLLVGLFYVVVLAMDIYPPDPLPYRLKQYLPAAIHSRTSFKVESKEQLQKAKEEAQRSTSASFKSTGLAENIVAVLKSLPQELNKEPTTQPDKAREMLLEQFGLSVAEGVKAWRPTLKAASSGPMKIRSARSSRSWPRPPLSAARRPGPSRRSAPSRTSGWWMPRGAGS